MDYLINTPEEADDQTFGSSEGGSSLSQSRPESFSPNVDALNTLVEMGYDRDDSIYALRVTGNNLEHACSYLMSNPNPSRMGGVSSSEFRG